MATVGIDIGTGGTKAVIIDEHGAVRGRAGVEYPLTIAGPGIAEHDPQLYWRGVCAVVPRALQEAGVAPSEVAAVGVAGLSPVCILVDHTGKPLANALIWMDRRGVEQAAIVRDTLGDDAVFALSGNVIDTFYGLVKLLWTRDAWPAAYRAAARVHDVAGWINRRLTGAARMDLTNACLYGIAFDIRRRAWDTATLERLGLRAELLPPLAASGDVIGEVSAEAAAACGLRAGTPVVAGLVDGSAVCLAAGLNAPGDSVIFLGSSACLFVAQEDDAFARGLINIVHPAPSANDGQARYTAVGAMVGGGTMLRYVRDQFGEPERSQAERDGRDPYELLLEAAANTPAGADGLILLPYLMGERTPIWDPHATAALFGLRMHHTKAHLTRAALEGVAHGLRHNLDTLRAAGVLPREPVGIAEGGARSSLWRQIIADVLGVRLRWLGEAGGASQGAALLAGMAVGAVDRSVLNSPHATRNDETVPDPAARQIYDRAHAVYQALYQALKPLYVAASS